VSTPGAPSGPVGRVVSVSVTDAGAALARRLPYESRHGRAARTVAELWSEVDGLVLFLATGAAVRVVAPLLADKHRDPAVVAVDEAGRFAIALSGGHAGANSLAVDVAGLLGAEAVVTTATDSAGVAGLDGRPGWCASGDIAGVTAALLAGRRPLVERDLPADWPDPPHLTAGDGPHRVVLTDRRVPAEPGTAALHPPSLVVGVGTSSDARGDELTTHLEKVLGAAGLAAESVAVVATIDRRATHPAVVALGRPVVAYPAETLAAIGVPNASAVVAAAVGTPSVAEAAALAAAGPGSTLLVPKTAGAGVTVAVARRSRPPGALSVVGLGPGDPAHRTPAATCAVRSAEVVIGYGPYVDAVSNLLTASQDVRRSPIGAETERAREALVEAAAGREVALVCSGDAGIYAMASLVDELAGEHPEVDVRVVPGVTAAAAAAAALGAPLGHDHALISLSDLLTPWPVIERRISAAAEADLVVAFYNPRSRGRDWQLAAALEILGAHRPPTTPVGIVTDAARPTETVTITEIARVDPAVVGMTTCVIVGSSSTRVVAGRMVTPRGYGA